MEKPYLNVVTNNTPAEVYSKNADSLGIKFETDSEKLKQVYTSVVYLEFYTSKHLICRITLQFNMKRKEYKQVKDIHSTNEYM